ncbi:MAG: hypothetical protein K0Q55_3772 [Verrucomicrobia bacterium]|jgi:hypothetical protein|nr:hypothetical protein [Verrucomicrobiota bacterium]
MSRFTPTGEFQLDGCRFGWSIRHYGGSSSMYGELRGVSVSVFLPGQKTRELVLEFHVQDYWFQKPRSTTAFERRLQTCVSAAIAAGWDPESRGKAFRFAAEQLKVE